MSRSRTRARNRRARIEQIRAEFDKRRDDPEAFAHLLNRLADSDICIWPIALLAADERPLDEAERAMIAQTVAPRLAGMTAGSVHRRHEFSRRPGSATEHDEASSGRVSSLTPEG